MSAVEENINPLEEDQKALNDAAFFLNDLICVVSYGGSIPYLTIEYDDQNRPQVKVDLTDDSEE
ncbi:MAG TPA: hypothetical protein VIY48_14555 [Candidatus Paceibacterota bacterium]